MSEDGVGGEGVVLGGPSPKKQRPADSEEGEGDTQKWKVGALAAASKAPTFGKTTFAAAASGDAPGWLQKKPESASAGAGAAPSFFTSATKKVGTSSWLSGPSSASSTLGTVGSGVGATTKPPAWLTSSSLGSGTTSSSLGSTAPTTAPPAWLAASTGSAGVSASSASASSSSVVSSGGLFSAASKGGASWLKPSGSGASESTGSLTSGPALGGTAASAASQDKSEGDSPAQGDEQSSSPTKRRKYEEVGVRTGEESESCLQKVERVRLYHFRDGNWSERARECTLHLNETNVNGSGSTYRARIVIRTKETKSLVFNASLWPTMESQKHGASEKVTRICCYNVAETDGSGAVLGTYLISPSDKADGTRLRAGIEQAKLKCPAPKAGDAPAPNADGSSSSNGQESAGDTGTEAATITKLTTAQDAAASGTAGNGATNSKETEAPAKKLKTSVAVDTMEPAASVEPTAASVASTTASIASTTASVASTATTPAPSEVDATVSAGSSTVGSEAPKDTAQQQEEEEEDPDADL